MLASEATNISVLSLKGNAKFVAEPVRVRG